MGFPKLTGLKIPDLRKKRTGGERAKTDKMLNCSDQRLT